ncbi:MAG TPA: hypothetical protein VID67_01170 [Rhizomicrobium sp.]|jgi:hypothetical protein
MTIGKPFAIACATTVPVVWRSRPRVEKIHHSNELDGERDGAAAREDFASAKLARQKLCRNETEAVAPNWDEERLVPTFVTQILAQAMNVAGPATPSTVCAYWRGDAPKVALLCDHEA